MSSLLAGRSRRIVLAVISAAAIVALGCGVAFAYWSTSGSGNGSGATGTLTINVVAFSGGDANQTTLVPGGTGDVILRLNNPNSSSVQVSAITATGSITASNGCTPTGVSFVTPTDFSASQYTLTPGSHLLTVPGAVSMSTSSASSCQGATFTVPVSITVKK